MPASLSVYHSVATSVLVGLLVPVLCLAGVEGEMTLSGPDVFPSVIPFCSISA